MGSFKHIYWHKTCWFPSIWPRGQLQQVTTISDVVRQLAVLELP